MTSGTLEEAVPLTESSSLPDAGVPSRAARDLVAGTSALGTAILLERGFGFLANLLAARLGGASTFGAYSLAITTANNVSTYAAGGIASTAIRFSGRYGQGTRASVTLAKVLAIIAVVSAIIGALVLWAGAAPFAHLLGKPGLTPLLHWASLSVAGMILLECCRGFLVGQRQMRQILLLSSSVGLGMIALLPMLARVGPVPMIASQGAICIGAVLLCVSLFRPLRNPPEAAAERTETVPLGHLLREVWSFGLVQLAGLVGLNAAGWWLTSLLVRADTSMAQMGFFAIASQLRNFASLAPSLLTESSLAVMAQNGNEAERTPDRIMALCTWVTTFVSLALAGLGIALLPWLLPLLYGHVYAGATAAVAIALGTAVVHMGSGPANARLSILSIRTTGLINTVWALLVALAATTFLWWGGNAARAALIYFGAHVVSAALSWLGLRRRGSMAPGMGAVFATGGTTALVLVALSELRESHSSASFTISGLLVLAAAAGLMLLAVIARRHRWLPTVPQVRNLIAGLLGQRRKANV